MNPKTDAELVSNVKQGDIMAFEVLVRRYQNRLLRFAQRLVKNEVVAEEVVQDAFYSLYKTIERVDIERKLSSYLSAIVRNLAISRLRRVKPAASLTDLSEIAQEDRSLELLYNQDKKGEIERAICELPLVYQRVVRLYYFEELSYQELSRRLKLPLNTVRTQLRRARLTLRKKLSL